MDVGLCSVSLLLALALATVVPGAAITSGAIFMLRAWLCDCSQIEFNQSAVSACLTQPKLHHKLHQRLRDTQQAKGPPPLCKGHLVSANSSSFN